MRLTRHHLLIRALAEIDQQIAMLEDSSLEPRDSDQVLRAVALLFKLSEWRSKMERLAQRGGQ